MPYGWKCTLAFCGCGTLLWISLVANLLLLIIIVILLVLLLRQIRKQRLAERELERQDN